MNPNTVARELDPGSVSCHPQVKSPDPQDGSILANRNIGAASSVEICCSNLTVKG